MNYELLTVVLFGAFFVMLATGMPIAWLLAGVGMVFSYVVFGPSSMSQIALSTWSQMTSFTLIAIPLFIFMGYIIQESGLATALYETIYVFFGRLPGGLAVGTVAICTLMAAMVGTIGAGIVTASAIALPEMRKHGYNERMCIGAIMAGGTLGVLIPPSVGFLVYSGATGISVGKLFAAGLIPGLLLSALYMLYILVRCRFSPQMGPPMPETQVVTTKDKLASLKSSILSILLILSVLGSIFGGVATPTEAAALGAFFSLVIAAIYRRLNWGVVKPALYGTMRIFGLIFWIFVGATVFSRFYMGIGIKDYLADLLVGWEAGRWVVLIGMMLFILVAGTIVHDIAIILICAPLFTALVVELGFDPLWFGMLFLVNLQIAILSPPFGPALFYMRGCVSDEVGFRGVALAALPYIGVQLVGLVLCMLFPPIIMWLPNLIFG